jgi:hypothetical protein
LKSYKTHLNSITQNFKESFSRFEKLFTLLKVKPKTMKIMTLICCLLAGPHCQFLPVYCIEKKSFWAMAVEMLNVECDGKKRFFFYRHGIEKCMGPRSFF